jgi:hypothetical protein
MKLLLDVRKRLLSLLMDRHEQYFLLVVGIQFILYLLLFLLKLKIREVLKMGGEVKILYYLVVGMLYLGLLVLMEEVSYQIPQ